MQKSVRTREKEALPMTEQPVKLWSKDFVLIIMINFLVFMNHLIILSTFPFYVSWRGSNEGLAGLAAAAFSIVAVARLFLLPEKSTAWQTPNNTQTAPGIRNGSDTGGSYLIPACRCYFR